MSCAYETLVYYVDNVKLYEMEEQGSGEASKEGDASDVDALGHLFASGAIQWTKQTTSAEIVKYNDVDGISKPAGVEGNTLIKYTHVTTDTSDFVVNSMPLRYSGGDYAFNEEQKAIDFSKAELSFYIYNAMSTNLPVYFAYNIGVYPHVANKGYTTAVAGQWTKVAVDLSQYTIDAANDDYEIIIFVGAVDINADVIYYIDNVNIQEKQVVDANDADALGHLFARGAIQWNNQTTSAEIVRYAAIDGISKPDGVEGETLIKYTHVTTHTSDFVVNSMPLRYSGGDYAFNEEQKAIDFSKAELTFYIYNAMSTNLPVYFAYNIGVYPHVTNKGSTTAVAGQWTKVTVDLSQYTIDAANDDYEIIIFVGAVDINADVIYYIDNVTFSEVA